MRQDTTIDALMERGAGRPAPEAVVRLYREAFDRFGTVSLWSRTPGAAPTIAQALVIARSLRQDGDMRARDFATQIEDACRAAL